MKNQLRERLSLRTVLNALFLTLMFSLGFMQPGVMVGGMSVIPSDALFLIAGGVWLIALLIGKIKFKYDWTFYLFGLYAFGLLISVVFSEYVRTSVLKFPGEVYLIALAVMTFNLVNDWTIMRKVIIAWLAASVIASMIGAITVASFYLESSNFVTDFALHHYGSLIPGNYPRVQGTFEYPSLLCNYFTISVMLLLCTYNTGWINARVFAALAALFAVTVAFTVTPGIGGVILAVTMWYWFNSSNEKVARIALAAGVLAAGLFLFASAFTLVSSPTSPYHIVIGGYRLDPGPRLLTWQGALETFYQHPLFGRGLGLGVAEALYMPPSEQIQMLTDAHNVVLNVAGQAGLCGVIPIVLIMAAIVYRSKLFLSAEANRSPLLNCLGIAFFSAMIYQGLVGSFENARHVWVLMGLILAVSRIPQQSGIEPTAEIS